MTLGSDIAAALPGLRAQAESMMTAVCVITRGGERVWNLETLQYEGGTTEVYSGKCRVRPTGQQDRGTDAADQVFVESSYVLSLPVSGSEAVRKDDRVTVSTDATDAGLTGRTYVVVAAPAYSDGTARRIPVRETQ